MQHFFYRLWDSTIFSLINGLGRIFELAWETSYVPVFTPTIFSLNQWLNGLRVGMKSRETMTRMLMNFH